MANFSLDDLLNLEPSKVSRDLSGYITYVYGQPKVGKTTLAKDMGALILSCEDGTRAMSGAYAQIIKTWGDIRTMAKYLKDNRMKARYKAIAVDTVDVCASLCEKYVCNQLDISTLGEGGWVKNGWATFKKEFEEVFRNIALEGYAVLFISHDKQKEITRPDGSTYTKICPTVSESINHIVKSMSDIIIYGYQKFGTEERYMMLRSDDSVECGSRFPYMESEIPFGYQSLVDALNRAIDKEEEANGAAAVTDERVVSKTSVSYDYDALMTEFMNVTNEIQTKANPEDFSNMWAPKITQIVETYLGKGAKVSSCKREQVEQLALIVDDIKDLM